MLGAELRLAALHLADEDRNGWIDVLEAKDKRFVYRTVPQRENNGAEIDFGRFDDHNLDGQPDLNAVFYIVYVDGEGNRIPWAGKLTDPGVKGYRIEVQVFGHSQLRVQPAAACRYPSAFAAGAFDIHQGLQAYDLTTLTEVGRSGLSGISNAGCVQFVSARGRDRGEVRATTGLSLDDPDRDGVPHELTEGDLDIVEWYLLNHPRPARGRQTKLSLQGEKLFSSLGCIACHTANWLIPGVDPEATDYTLRHSGDRRFFDVEVKYNQHLRRLEGKLVSLAAKTSGVSPQLLPHRASFFVRDIYTDLRYHDVGPDFYQMQYDGTVLKQFRTPPLWGVGSTAPYGHDGANLDLESVILRHGGEAQQSRDQFAALGDDEQQSVVAFLHSLVLYQTDQLACDINGDDTIANSFVVAGKEVGLETLRPEWLLRIPCCIEGELENGLGGKVTSMAIANFATPMVSI